MTSGSTSNWRRRALPAAAGLALLSLASPAFAYLDPSTGSMILSAVIGLFATVGLAVKTYWYRLKAWFRGPAPGPDAPADRARQPARANDAGVRDGGGSGDG